MTVGLADLALHVRGCLALACTLVAFWRGWLCGFRGFCGIVELSVLVLTSTNEYY